MSWTWPPLVVLGSCCTAHVHSRRGQEPLGFPVACLLGGVQTVVSASAPIRDKTADDVLARLDEDIIAGRDVLGSLHHHTLALLHEDRTLRDAPPSWWATLISWTVRSPRTPPLDNTAFSPTYDLRGVSPESDRPGTSAAAPDEGQRVRRPGSVPLSARTMDTLTYAQSAPDRNCLTTVDFVRAAIAVDHVRSADWTAFTVACGVADLPDPRRPRTEDAEALTELRRDSRPALASARLARAIELGVLLAAQLKDPRVEPWHVLFGIIADPASDAAQWLNSGVEEPTPPVASSATWRPSAPRLRTPPSPAWSPKRSGTATGRSRPTSRASSRPVQPARPAWPWATRSSPSAAIASMSQRTSQPSCTNTAGDVTAVTVERDGAVRTVAVRLVSVLTGAR